LVRSDGVQIKHVVSHSVYEAFKAEISVNAPYLYKGFISSEVEKALQYYIVLLRKRRSNMQHAARQQQNNVLIKLRDCIFEYMRSQTKIWPEGPTQHITEKHLLEAIASIKGAIDSRTPRKWRDRLFRAGFIERTGPRQYIFCGDYDLPKYEVEHDDDHHRPKGLGYCIRAS
jgi:hypothetical protein